MIRRALVKRPRARAFACNMHAPGAGDATRMAHAMRRFDHLDFSIGGLAEFNLTMANAMDDFELWDVHRAEVNLGGSGNAIPWRIPVWEMLEDADLPVHLPDRTLTMAGGVFEHKRTRLVLPVLAIHNPAAVGKSASPQGERDQCTHAEFDWAQRMTATHGRALVLGDFNEAGALRGVMHRAAAHHVDEVYGRGVTFSKPVVHHGFVDDNITDHPAISVLIKV